TRQERAWERRRPRRHSAKSRIAEQKQSREQERRQRQNRIGSDRNRGRAPERAETEHRNRGRRPKRSFLLRVLRGFFFRLRPLRPLRCALLSSSLRGDLFFPFQEEPCTSSSPAPVAGSARGSLASSAARVFPLGSWLAIAPLSRRSPPRFARAADRPSSRRATFATRMLRSA